MYSLVHLVSIVVYVFVLFQEYTAVHIDVAHLSTNSDDQIKQDDLQPIEQEFGSEDLELSQISDNEDYVNFNQLPQTSDEKTKTNEVRNRVVRQVKGNLYPQLGTNYYGNNPYSNPPGQGTSSNNPQWNRNYDTKSYNGYNNSFSQNPLTNTTFNGYSQTSYPSSQNNYYNGSGSPQGYPHNPQWDRNSNRNNSFSSNPFANITFNGNPSSSYSSSKNNFYNNPGSYNTPRPQNSQWDTNRSHNGTNPYNTDIYNGYNSSLSSNPLANTTFNGYPSPSQNYYNGSKPNQYYSSSNTSPRYPTYSSYPSASVKPGYPSDWRNYSSPSQGNIHVNNSSYGYTANNTRPGYPNPYDYTTPRYPSGLYPNSNYYVRNNSAYDSGPGYGQSHGNYNPSYPFPPQFNSSVTKPSDYGKNSSHGSYPRQNNPYPYGYSNSNSTYPGTQYGNNNYGAYSSTPSYDNGSPRPSFVGYPSSNNNQINQGQNNWKPGQPYNSNNPHESLFNYPTTQNFTQYDPRKNPSHQFSY